MNNYNDIFNDMDAARNALASVNLRESVMPLYRGRIIENTEIYDKVHKLLDSEEMERAHKFLYDVDYNNLNDDTVKKVDELYDYAVSNGFIQDQAAPVQVNDEDEPLDSAAGKDPLADEKPEDKEEEIAEDGEECEDGECNHVAADAGSQVSEPAPQEVPAPAINATTPKSCVCLYTAMKNGKLHTGECSSDACDPDQAKSDVINKLTQFGYSDINILAIEDGVPGGASAQVSDYGQKAITNTNKTFDTKKPSDILMQDETVQESGKEVKKISPEDIIKEDDEEIVEAEKDDNEKDDKEKEEKDKKKKEEKKDDKAEDEPPADEGDEEIEEDPSDEEEIEEDPADDAGDEPPAPPSDDEPADEPPAPPSDDEPADDAGDEPPAPPSDDEPADEPPTDEPPADTDEPSDDEEEIEEEPSDDSEEKDDEDKEDKDNKEKEDKDDDKEDKEEKDDDKPLSKEEKVKYATEYIKKFKQVLVKTDAPCFNELPLEDRAKFFEKLSKEWTGKPDPSKFMTKANIEKLESMKVEKDKNAK